MSKRERKREKDIHCSERRENRINTKLKKKYVLFGKYVIVTGYCVVAIFAHFTTKSKPTFHQTQIFHQMQSNQTQIRATVNNYYYDIDTDIDFDTQVT